MIQTYVPDNWYTELRVRSINPGRVTWERYFGMNPTFTWHS